MREKPIMDDEKIPALASSKHTFSPVCYPTFFPEVHYLFLFGNVHATAISST